MTAPDSAPDSAPATPDRAPDRAPEPATLLQACGAQIAEVLPGGPPLGRPIDTQVLSRRNQRLVLRIAGADGAVIVKAFAPNASGTAGYRREREVLTLLAPTTLGPRLLATLDDAAVLVMTEVPGQALDDRNNLPLARDTAAALGHWIAAFERQMPLQAPPQTMLMTSPVTSPATSPATWAAHFARMSEPGLAQLVHRQADMLNALPPVQFGLARNDGHLSNMRWSAASGMVGYDFEAAAWHPLGWDLLLAARALNRRYPTAARAPITALVEGWTPHTKHPVPNAVVPLVHAFATATAFP